MYTPRSRKEAAVWKSRRWQEPFCTFWFRFCRRVKVQTAPPVSSPVHPLPPRTANTVLFAGPGHTPAPSSSTVPSPGTVFRGLAREDVQRNPDRLIPKVQLGQSAEGEPRATGRRRKTGFTEKKTWSGWQGPCYKRKGAAVAAALLACQ